VAAPNEITLRLRMQEVARFIADARAGSAAVKGLEDSVNSAERRARFASGGGGGFGALTATIGVLGRGARWGALGVGVLGGMIGRVGTQSASGMEQAKIGFETMLGSAEKADAFLRDMARFAEQTPFDFPGLIQASQRLLAFGFAAEKIKPMLTTIGDAASGLGAGAEGIDRITLAIGQMQAKTKIQGDELLQLTEIGIPALQILAEGLGKSTAKVSEMSRKGLLSAKEGIPILLEGMDRRFGGLMAKQSKSLSGLWSTFKDVSTTAARNLMEPLVPAMSAALERANAAMPGLAERAGRFSRRATRELPRAVSALRSGDTDWAAWHLDKAFGGTGALRGPAQEAMDIGRDLAKIWRESVAPAFRDVGDALGPLKPLLAPITDLSSITGFLADHTDGLHRVLTVLLATLVSYRVLVLGINTVLRVHAAITGIVAAAKGTETAVTNAQKVAALGNLAVTKAAVVWGRIQKSTIVTFVGVKALEAGAWAKSTLLAARHTAAMVAQRAIILAVRVATLAWVAVQWALNAALSANPIGLIILGIAALVAGVIWAYKKFPWFRAAVQAALHGVKVALGWLVDGAKFVWNWIKDHWPMIKKWLIGPIGAAVLYIIRHWDQVKDAFTVEGMKRRLRYLWDGLKEGFRNALNFIIDKWNGLKFTTPSFEVFGQEVGGITVGVVPLPRLEHGGTAVEGGWSVVGEAGPELRYLPKGASVVPLPKVPDLDLGEIKSSRRIEVPVFLNGREIARAVHDEDDRALARL
jgi:tape measure domain-containing protein